MREPYCSRCKTIKNLIPKPYAYGGKDRKIGYYYCRQCQTERVKKYRETPEGRVKIYNAVKVSTEKHYYKQQARGKVAHAIKIGKLKNPRECSICQSNNIVEAHHSDYTKPLIVKWLCRSCHADLHSKAEPIQ